METQPKKIVGRKRHPLYITWCGMLSRCRNPNAPYYEIYGGRGITVCERWRDSFEDYAADVGEKPGPDYTLGRIDNDGNYEPGNVEWQTRTKQQNNRSNNRRMTYGGKTQTVAEWAKELGVRASSLFLRLDRGWTDEEVITLPLNRQQKRPTTRNTGSSPAQAASRS